MLERVNGMSVVLFPIYYDLSISISGMPFHRMFLIHFQRIFLEFVHKYLDCQLELLIKWQLHCQKKRIIDINNV